MPDIPEEVRRYMSEIAKKRDPEEHAESMKKARANRWTPERRQAHSERMKQRKRKEEET